MSNNYIVKTLVGNFCEHVCNKEREPPISLIFKTNELRNVSSVYQVSSKNILITHLTHEILTLACERNLARF